ncbi:SHOCT domain-containing protein [Nitratifractor sp.]
MMNGQGFGFGMGLGWIIPLLILWGLYYLFFRSRTTGKRGKSPRQILDERFASGAIDEEEYRRRIEVLDAT